MTTSNIQTFGTTMSWAGTAVGTVRAITGPGESVESEDITNHGSPSAYREKVPTLIDGGEVGLEIIYSHEAGQTALRAAFAARTVAEVILELPDTAGTSGTTFTFGAFISKWDWAIPDAGALKASISITVAGAVAVAEPVA
jgi:hypothetical protein